jgi:hypothetical protein
LLELLPSLLSLRQRQKAEELIGFVSECEQSCAQVRLGEAKRTDTDSMTQAMEVIYVGPKEDARLDFGFGGSSRPRPHVESDTRGRRSSSPVLLDCVHVIEQCGHVHQNALDELGLLVSELFAQLPKPGLIECGLLTTLCSKLRSTDEVSF